MIMPTYPITQVADTLEEVITVLKGPENAFLRGECRKHIATIRGLMEGSCSCPNPKKGNPQSEHVRKLEARFLKQGFSKKNPRD